MNLINDMKSVFLSLCAEKKIVGYSTIHYRSHRRNFVNIR